MHIRTPAILVAARQHGETAVIGRFLTEEHGLLAGYVAGGRGRQLRPVVIPGNVVDLQLSAKSDSQLPFARVELVTSRGPWLAEPLPAAAIHWITAITASSLPEQEIYREIFQALSGTLDAICHAPSARGWAGALVGYETLLLRELGYGGAGHRPEGELATIIAAMDALEEPIAHYLLADRRADVMATRQRLRQLLQRIA